MRVATVEPDNLDLSAAIVRDAAAVLADGGLIVFPTETVYGVGACATSDSAFARLRALRADAATTFAVHLPDAESAELYTDASSPTLRRFVNKVFPGPVTLLIDTPDEVIDRHLQSRRFGLGPELRGRIYRGNTVALRCPDQQMTRRILSEVRQPVVACAANVEGAEPARDAAEASRQLAGKVDYVVDAGGTRYAQPSTIVRVTVRGSATGIVVERSGVYDERMIRKLARWTVLIVCSGNTCRSPMGAAIASYLLAQQRGVAVDQLDASGVRVVSAGTMAMDGMLASAEAVAALAREDIDLRGHHSRSLTAELIHEADVIYTMTESHRQAVVNLVPAADAKTFRLDESGDIADPIGLDIAAYQSTAKMIRRLLAERLKGE